MVNGLALSPVHYRPYKLDVFLLFPIRITLHLFMLNSICHSLAQSNNLCKSSYKLFLSRSDWCVHPSVYISQAGTVPKRLNTGSRKQRRTYCTIVRRSLRAMHLAVLAQETSFLVPKISAKFQRGHAQRGAK